MCEVGGGTGVVRSMGGDGYWRCEEYGGDGYWRCERYVLERLERL